MTNLNEEEKTFWKKVPLIDGMLKKILRYNREKIHKIFVKQTNYNSNNSILDIGTTSSLDDNHNIILQKTRDNKNVFCLSDQDLFILKKKYPHIKQFITGDGKKTNFKKDNFDIIFVSATIEHVGSYNNQVNFIRESVRISKNYVFITTPNRYYPFDLHTKIPLIHWLPKKVVLFTWFPIFSQENPVFGPIFFGSRSLWLAAAHLQVALQCRIPAVH